MTTENNQTTPDMPPALLATILPILAKEVPVLVIDLVQVLSKPAVTDADWTNLKLQYAGLTYDQYIAQALARAATPTAAQ